MKNNSIKYNILINFFIATLMSIISTLVGVFLVIMWLHIFCPSLYMKFTNDYNTNSSVMLGFIIEIFVIFIVLMCLIFIKRMNRITDYIEEISQSLNIVANGNMNINIPIRNKNELGTLASAVNKMAYSIKELMKKERQWEKQKNNLITNLSHDLRTPLTSILGFLELIQNGNYKNNDELYHYCEVSLSKAKELKSSVDQLFEFTKISNGDVNLNKSNIYLQQLIEQATIGFIPSFENSSMEYRISSKDAGLIINGDAILLVRAFENIIANAIKYGSEGKYLDINIEKENNMAVVSFVNYGDIIEEENLKNLFQRLYRVEKSCDKKEGTGLGLAIVKTIVELHNGGIEVKSSKGKTEFKIKLPFN
ncbi:HAMP domain-containing histidine kinase [Clostridium tagluense]|uniref:sensor histidine kinase n=1 Tax=Clostridium tagluense TaxID=360422 RepID=UPI001CF5784F|nr:HAMP domain-containing sensor histidine kinase [Clostridium tagluense]MCB2312638.1 HAMP domain-containing histidine kinase [Clostridium tagluense]MCB2317314.1 HAMP domain-containing histidine kinase [Clostridium tagluense]MCB2322181.1 HAMP domain-containing histidine kinase [Clostridium tagluense]MCB2327110.1 HAMP domain-containing histidine kinase [Clostridium tagluense]MCB2331828.1 HAMP domain-containing histidine kinase [Clostridium tagluense]